MLLRLLHDADLPVLGQGALGEVVQDDQSGLWRWEIDGIQGEGLASRAAAQEELRLVRSRLCPAWEKADGWHEDLVRLKRALEVEKADRLALQSPVRAAFTCGNGLSCAWSKRWG